MRNQSIDILKFLCAMMIVFLHTSTFIGHPILLPITRCAVPCFFIISGYLMYSSDLHKLQERLSRSIKKILKILLYSSVLFATISFISYLRKESNEPFITGLDIVKFILFNENPFGFHLWYISAYLYVLIFFYVFARKPFFKNLIWFIPGLLIIDLIFGKYSLLLWGKQIPYIYLRNFLFVGIPYFFIGFFIKKYTLFQKISVKKLLFLIFFFVLSSIFESFILTFYHVNAVRDHYISSTFLAVSLFVLFKNTHFSSSLAKKIAFWGEKYSLDIYILHPIFLIFYNGIIPVHMKLYYSYFSPLLIIGTTFFTAYIFERFKVQYINDFHTK